jgi:hypothetical protein
MKHIFISYSPKDTRYMTTMRDNLLRIGFRPWIDRMPRPNADWRFEIDDAIRGADGVLVLVSPAAAESVYVTYEWALALGHGVPVVPVVFANANLHPRLLTLEHFNFSGFKNEAHFWDYFTREIQRIFNTTPEPNMEIPVIPQVAVQVPAPVPAQVVLLQPLAPVSRQIMPQQPGHYIVVRRGPMLNHMFLLNKQVLSLGRDATNDIPIDDPEVSRYHLRLRFNGQTYNVEDLGSTNGTRINGGPRITGETMLQPGNILMLGDTIALSYEFIP